MADQDFNVDEISSMEELDRAKAFYQNQPPELPKQMIEANRILQDRFLVADRRVEEDQRVQRIENAGPTDAQMMDEKLRAQSQSGEANKREMEDNARDVRSPGERESENLALHGEDVGKRREDFERKNREDQERSVSNAMPKATEGDSATVQATGEEAAEAVLQREFSGQQDTTVQDKIDNRETGTESSGGNAPRRDEALSGENPNNVNAPAASEVFSTKNAQNEADVVNASDKDQPSTLSEEQLNKEVLPQAGDQRTGTSDKETPGA